MMELQRLRCFVDVADELHYDAAGLLEFLRAHGTGKPEEPSYYCSNLGARLLGYALANHANMPFVSLLGEQVLRAPGMTESMRSKPAWSAVPMAPGWHYRSKTTEARETGRL